jgi:hypothetical protein
MNLSLRSSDGEEHLTRVRRLCLSLPGASEKPSHGEPTFFVKKRTFAMYSDNHHKDGHISVLIPLAPGHQEMLIQMSPHIYYRPPYVGVKGWVGINLNEIDDEALAVHIREAWELINGRGRLQGRSG